MVENSILNKMVDSLRPGGSVGGGVEVVVGATVVGGASVGLAPGG